jgi:hypothetical protein
VFNRNPRDRQRRHQNPALEFPPLEQALIDIDQFIHNYKSRDIPEDKLKRIYYTYKK